MCSSCSPRRSGQAQQGRHATGWRKNDWGTVVWICQKTIHQIGCRLNSYRHQIWGSVWARDTKVLKLMYPTGSGILVFCMWEGSCFFSFLWQRNCRMWICWYFYPAHLLWKSLVILICITCIFSCDMSMRGLSPGESCAAFFTETEQQVQNCCQCRGQLLVVYMKLSKHKKKIQIQINLSYWDSKT
jgi:hypothetical protein